METRVEQLERRFGHSLDVGLGLFGGGLNAAHRNSVVGNVGNLLVLSALNGGFNKVMCGQAFFSKATLVSSAFIMGSGIVMHALTSHAIHRNEPKMHYTIRNLEAHHNAGFAARENARRNDPSHSHSR